RKPRARTFRPLPHLLALSRLGRGRVPRRTVRPPPVAPVSRRSGPPPAVTDVCVCPLVDHRRWDRGCVLSLPDDMPDRRAERDRVMLLLDDACGLGVVEIEVAMWCSKMAPQAR